MSKYVSKQDDTIKDVASQNALCQIILKSVIVTGWLALLRGDGPSPTSGLSDEAMELGSQVIAWRAPNPYKGQQEVSWTGEWQETLG